ncbi:MAG: hypothetical protein TECD_01231 [Hyphomicrobiaceae bacterium hypho_1]
MITIFRKRRRSRWDYKKSRICLSLLPILILIIVISVYVENFNCYRFLGFPLGYFMISHGLWIIAIFTMCTHVGKRGQNDDIRY